VKNLEPQGAARLVLNALVLLLAISFAAHEIVLWLTPVVPVLIGGAVVVMIWAAVFGRRWR